MSVIAWDGHTLAGDKRACLGTLIATTTKVFRMRRRFENEDPALAAYAGSADAGEELLAWFKAGAKPQDFPPQQRDRERQDWGSLLVVWPDGVLWKYESTPYPVRFPPQKFAIGSGRDFALAAMHCGKSAAEAVAIACVFDSGCGNGVDALTHRE